MLHPVSLSGILSDIVLILNLGDSNKTEVAIMASFIVTTVLFVLVPICSIGWYLTRKRNNNNHHNNKMDANNDFITTGLNQSHLELCSFPSVVRNAIPGMS